MTKRIPTLAFLAATVLSTAALAADGTATVTLGSETYTLKVIACSGGPGAFSLQAKADSDTTVIQLGAFDGEVKSVGFRVGDTMAQVSDQTGTFDGTTFEFEGEAQVFKANSINRQILRVTASCN